MRSTDGLVHDWRLVGPLSIPPSEGSLLVCYDLAERVVSDGLLQTSDPLLPVLLVSS